MTKPTRPPWYAEGLRFECQPECGACCTDHEDYAYVYLEGDDLERLAACLDLAPDEFRCRFTTEEDGHTVLKMDRPECPFLDGTACTVYEARPAQCRTFPFWSENLRSRARWQRLCRFCPGIDSGRLYTVQEIGGELAQRRQ